MGGIGKIDTNYNNGIETVDPVTTDTVPEKLKTPIKKKSIEKRKPLEAETKSINSLNAAGLDGKRSIKVVADFLGVKNQYDKNFIVQLKEFQKDYGLKVDGILGPETISFILINKAFTGEKGFDAFISLLKDKNIQEFSEAIKNNNVTDEQLKKYENIMTSDIDKLLLNIQNGNIFKNNKNYIFQNLPTIGMSLLMEKFDRNNKNNPKYKNHFERMEKIKKQYEKNPIVNNITNNPQQSLIQYSNLSKEEKEKAIKNYRKMIKNIKNQSSQNSETTGNGFDFKNNPGLAFDNVSRRILSNPVFMLIGIVGFFKLIFGKADSPMGKVGMAFLALMAGSSGAGKMIQDTLRDTGFLKKSPSSGSQTASTKVENFTNNVDEKTKTFIDKTAEELGKTAEEVKLNFNKKLKKIKTNILSEHPNINQEKLNKIITNVSFDENFRYISINKITQFKFSSLTKDTQEKLKKDGITEKSKEWKLYLEYFKKAANEENSKITDSSKKIKTVGDYFDKGNIDGNDIGLAAGIGFMAWGLLSKSPVKFFLGAGAVAESTTHFIQDFFTSGEGEKYVKKAKEITDRYINRINVDLNNLEIINKDKKIINALLYNGEKPDFEEIRKRYKNNTKVLDFVKSAEENYYEAEVKSKTGTNSYITGILDYAKEKYTETTGEFEKAKEDINVAIKGLKKLKSEVNDSGLEASKKTLLIAKLDLEIKKANAKINEIEAQKKLNRKNNKKEIEKKLNNLNNKLKKLSSEKYTGDDKEVKEAEREIKIIELKNQITQKKAELKKASNEVSVLENKTIEKKLDTYKENIKNIMNLNSKFDTENINNPLTDIKIDNIALYINNLKEIEKYTGSKQEINSIKTNLKNSIKELKDNIKKYANSLINKINLDNYLDKKNKISEITRLFNILEIETTIFTTKIKTKLTEEFNTKINNADIEQIQKYKKFSNEIEGANDKITNRLKYLAKNTEVKDVKEIRDFIENLKTNEILTNTVIQEIKAKNTIFELYKYIYNVNNLSQINTLKNKIKNLYGEFYIEKKVSSIENNKTNTNQIPTSNNNEKKITKNTKNKVLSPDDIFGS